MPSTILPLVQLSSSFFFIVFITQSEPHTLGNFFPRLTASMAIIFILFPQPQRPFISTTPALFDFFFFFFFLASSFYAYFPFV